jgi:hypothetical protein
MSTPAATPTTPAPAPWSSRRLIENTLLVLVGVLLAVGTVYDVTREVGVNHRLIADLATWRAVSGRHYHNLTIEQDQTTHSTRDVICGNTSPGAPKEHTQLCFVMTGPVVHGRRVTRGGYYLPPRLVFDSPSKRYGCFGAAVEEELCTHPGAPAAGMG